MHNAQTVGIIPGGKKTEEELSWVGKGGRGIVQGGKKTGEELSKEANMTRGELSVIR